MGNGFLICLMIRNGRGRWVAKGMVAVVIELRLLSGLDACLLLAGHQRCSKRWVVWGEGKLRSSIWVEVR